MIQTIISSVVRPICKQGNDKLKVVCKLLYPVLSDKPHQRKDWLLITYEDLLGLDLLNCVLNPVFVDQIILFLVHVTVGTERSSV